MPKKILVIGANGQLGTDLVKVLSLKHQVIASTRKDFDVTDRKRTNKFIKKHQPDVVIHTAAFHRVLDCELDPERSFEENGVGVFNTASVAKEVGATILFISTDYVFNGQIKGYKESDLPQPLNIYGASKLLGEQLVRIANPKYYIVRTGWLYGAKVSSKGHNFPQLMLKKSAEDGELSVVDDQYGSPTYTKDLAEQISCLIKKEPKHGIYHLTNSGVCSWYEFAKYIFQSKQIKIKVNKTKTDTAQQVQRPRYSILINSKSQRAGLPEMRSWKLALAEYLESN